MDRSPQIYSFKNNRPLMTRPRKKKSPKNRYYSCKPVTLKIEEQRQGELFTPRVSNSVLSYKTQKQYRPSPKNRRFFSRRSTNGAETTDRKSKGDQSPERFFHRRSTNGAETSIRKSLGIYSPEDSPRRVNNRSVEPQQSGSVQLPEIKRGSKPKAKIELDEFTMKSRMLLEQLAKSVLGDKSSIMSQASEISQDDE